MTTYSMVDPMSRAATELYMRCTPPPKKYDEVRPERNTKLQAELDQTKAEIRQFKAERFGKSIEKAGIHRSFQ